MTTRRLAWWTVAVLGALAAPTRGAELGAVDFANSGASEAQAAFHRDLAALHSFWYGEADDALELLQEAAASQTGNQ